MFFNKKFFLVVLLILIAFIFIQTNFAIDNETVNLNSDVERVDIYFNASALVDGDGSFEKPYKELRETRIVSNSNIHLAEGNYVYNPNSHVGSSLGYNMSLIGKSNVSFSGANPEETIIKTGDIYIFQPSAKLTLNNLTLVNTNINVASGSLVADNVIFKDSKGIYCDGHHNYIGGVIYAGVNSNVELSNCQFINTSSEYGGAIYVENGDLKIINSSFINTTSTLLGGAILAIDGANVNVSKTKFINSQSSNGGAIYLFESSLIGYDLNFTYCDATFGKAICSLNSTTLVDESVFESEVSLFALYGDLNISNSNFINELIIVNDVNFTLSYNNFSGISTGIQAFDTQVDITTNQGISQDNVFEITQFNYTAISGDYSLFTFNLTEYTDELPSYYNLVDDGYVSPVKDQKNGGNCWSFTAMAVLESCILKLTNTTYDLSENNLKNLMAYYSNWGWNSKTNDGGKVGMTLGYFSSWLGPVLDETDIYSDRGVLSDIFDAVFHVDNALLLQRLNFTDNDEVKRAILTYGAVGGDLCYADQFLKTDTCGYYCDYSYSSNHAVTIVGWDDTYSKNNFLTTPEGDGAWIIKNSWGTDWGDNGFAYVSYYDKSLTHGSGNYLYTLKLDNVRQYDKNYQYDMGYSITSKYTTKSFLYKNIFTSSDDEYLVAVSTYFFSPVNWTVNIIVNGESVLNKSGSAKAGYHTIDLNTSINLNKGDVFEVVFNQTTSGENNVTLPLMNYADFNKNVSQNGVSFIYNGGKWIDINVDHSAVIAIKAFTIFDKNVIIKLNVTEDNITATVVDSNGGILNSGNITFEIEDFTQTVDVKDGVASIKNDFTHLEYYTVIATFEGEGYNITSANRTVHHNLEINFDVKNIVYGNNITLNITLNEDMELHNNITVVINNKSYSIPVLTQNTTYSIIDSLNASEYVANLVYVDEFNNINKNVSFNITKATNNINVTVNNVTYPDMVRITVNADVSGTYAVYVGNQIVNVQLSDKTGFSDVLLDAGNYTTYVLWDNSNYDVTVENTAFMVSKATLELNITPVVYQNKVRVTINASKAINTTINVYTPNLNIMNLTDGGVSFNSSNLDFGNYNITVVLNDNNFNFINKTVSFNITCYTPQITIDVEDINVGEVLNVGVKITSNSEVKATGNLTINIADFNQTSDVGSGVLNYSISDLKYGDYVIIVTYDGDELHAEQTVNKTFSVSRITPSIIVSNSIKYGEGINFKLSNGMTGNITVNINNDDYNLNYNGYDFYVQIQNLTIGSYDLKVIFDGDDKFLPLNLSQSLVITKMNTIVVYLIL